MEAQGDLLADYFVLKHRGAPRAMRWPRNGASVALFESVLAGFLLDPASRSHLPRLMGRRRLA